MAGLNAAGAEYLAGAIVDALASTRAVSPRL